MNWAAILLDTTVVSEWMKPLPNPGRIRWLAEVDEDRVYLAVKTLAELRYATERLAPGARKLLWRPRHRGRHRRRLGMNRAPMFRRRQAYRRNGRLLRVQKYMH